MNTIPPLSEAMRLGAMLRPQGRPGLGLSGERTCAMYAASEAIGVTIVNYDEWLKFWPVLNLDAVCPVCHETHWLLAVITIHLNDDHGWTRERIADWVESVEPQEAAVGEELEKQEVG